MKQDFSDLPTPEQDRHSAWNLDWGFGSLLSFRFRWVYVGLAFGLLFAAALGTWLVYRKGVTAAEGRFERLAESNAAYMGRRLSQYQDILKVAARDLRFGALDDRRRWREFALPQYSTLEGLEGIGFIRWIPAAQKQAFVAKVRAEGFPEFTLRPEGDRLEYTAVEYLEPFEGRNLRAFGYDLWTEPIRQHAMALARDTGRPSLSGRLVLAQETSIDRQPGVLLFVPVYLPDAPVHSIEQRRESLVGFIFCPFRVRELMRNIQLGSGAQFSFAVYNGVDQEDANLLYDQRSELPSRVSQHDSAYTSIQSLSQAGQVWTVVYRSLPEFEVLNDPSIHWYVLAGELIIIGLVLLFLAQFSGIQKRIEERAEHITVRLKESELALGHSHSKMEQAYAQLSEIAGLHKAILDSAGYAIISTDPSGIILTFNPAAEAMLGYSAQELVGKVSPAIFHDAHEVAQRAKELSIQLDELIEPGFEVFVARARRRLHNEFEWSYIRKEGKRVPVILTVTALSDAKNQIIGFLGIAVDISERKRDERRLMASMRETRDLKAALDAHAIVEITDRSGAITYANENFCAISKYTRGELLGQNHRILNSGYHTSDFFAELYTTINRGKIWRGEVRNRAKDGSIFWVDTTIVPFSDDKGAIYEFVIIRMEVTARKEAEQARVATETLLRQFITHTPAAVAMLDENGVFLHVSERWISDFSVDSAPMQGTPLNAHSCLPPQWLDVFSSVMAGGVRTSENDFFERADGRNEWIQWEARPWQKLDGSIGGVMIFSQIVTTRRQMDLQLSKQNQELARSNSELEQFAYIASHDLQEPLRAVAGCVEILQNRYKGQLDQRADELIFHTVDGAHRMQVLITDLLSYSRVSTKGGELAACRMDSVLDSVLQNLSAQLTQSACEIERGKLPEVWADRVQVVLLLQNLIGNSLKFRAAATPRIRIEAELLGSEWCFRVIDNGIGIDPAFFGRVFGIFQRLHTRDAYPGTGIGLAICKKIVERHGGRIWVESNLDSGTSFLFTLPALPSSKDSSTDTPL